jgi:hypothetical protein
VVIEKWRMDGNRKRPHSARLQAACPAACSLMVPNAIFTASAGDVDSVADLIQKLSYSGSFAVLDSPSIRSYCVKWLVPVSIVYTALQ